VVGEELSVHQDEQDDDHYNENQYNIDHYAGRI
jgi:hypothetical protein